MATTEELEAQVKAQYPAYVYLLEEPELRQLLLDAVNPDIGFSPEEFTAKFQASEWYRTHSDTERQWDALLAADPASANRQSQERLADMRNMAAQVGVTIDPTTEAYLVDLSLRFGWTDTEIRNRLLYHGAGAAPPAEGQATPGGDLGTAYDEIRRLANTEYLVGIAPQDAWTWAQRVAAGSMTMDSVKIALGDVARGRFSQLAGLIDQGITPGSYFAPYRQMIADEMELGSVDGVNLLDPKWADMLSHPDGKDVRAMTMSEAQAYVRKQPEWDKTSRARSMGAGLANELLRGFGAIA